MGLVEGSDGGAKGTTLVAVGGGMKRNKRTLVTMNGDMKKESGVEDKKEIKDLQLCGHSKHLWTERQRRKKMQIMFQDLQALLPCHSSPKEHLATIVDEAIAYVKTLEETIQELENQKLEKLCVSSSTAELDTASRSRIAPFCFTRLSPPVFQTWTSPNVSLDVCGADAYITICSSKKSQLITRICFVMEKYKINIISIKIYSDKYRSMFIFHVQANAHDEVLTASCYEELLKKAALEILLLVNSKSS
ncbi:myc-type, basic helix-loop-helix (bHLH) domain-containing protein [Artemisia annua]|uniref:Myc-type, basic helix-loop-helix (BHLH) domain-containing protein n=1 Tax=Artemisia annua TaxID=35608 RepID=A0A2U1NZF2_ARTAN|nr:myc-type, basic helix-loop-helix (bHLH) domain-containing protein [Artemisia annua]